MKTIKLNKVIKEIESFIFPDFQKQAEWNHALILTIRIIKDNIQEKNN